MLSSSMSSQIFCGCAAIVAVGVVAREGVSSREGFSGVCGYVVAVFFSTNGDMLAFGACNFLHRYRRSERIVPFVGGFMVSHT